MKGVLFTTKDPLVSSDLNHVAASSTAALPQTQVIDGKLARVLCGTTTSGASRRA